MDTLRSASHLQRELGDDLFNALVSSDNTEAVRRFASGLVLPTEMTVGGRTYDILNFLWGDEPSCSGDTMVERAIDLQAHLGKDDARNLREHEEEIPKVLQGKVTFVFTDYKDPDILGDVACFRWNGRHWLLVWTPLELNFPKDYRVLRRKPGRFERTPRSGENS